MLQQSPEGLFQILSAQLAGKSKESCTVRLYIDNQTPQAVTVKTIGFMTNTGPRQETLSETQHIPGQRVGTIVITLERTLPDTILGGFRLNNDTPIQGSIRRKRRGHLNWSAVL